MSKVKISFCLNSIHPDKWANIYNQLLQSVGDYSFEVIAIGPYFPPISLQGIYNFRYIRDFGNPSRCVQLASTVAEGQYFTWLADDCIMETDGFSDCIKILDQKDRKAICNVLYSEGQNYTGINHLIPEYWTARFHDDQKLKGVKDWKIAIFGIYTLDYWKEMGGVDCKFEHINMNSHDLAFRCQRNGSEVFSSPKRVFLLDWRPWDNVNKHPIQLAYEENDKALFTKLYDTNEERPLKIDLNNWSEADSIWKRRFKVEQIS